MILEEVVRVAVLSALDIIERELSDYDARSKAAEMVAEQLRQKLLLRSSEQDMWNSRIGRRIP
jgi:hypothetical protein